MGGKNCRIFCSFLQSSVYSFKQFIQGLSRSNGKEKEKFKNAVLMMEMFPTIMMYMHILSKATTS